MQALTNWFIRNPVAANLIMLLILVSGYLSINSIRIEGFPKQAADTIVVDTTFIGGIHRADRRANHPENRKCPGRAKWC